MGEQVGDQVGDRVRLARSGWPLDDDKAAALEPFDDLALLFVGRFGEVRLAVSERGFPGF